MKDKINHNFGCMWTFIGIIAWGIAALQYYLYGKIDLPGLFPIYGKHALYVLGGFAPLVFVVLPFWLNRAVSEAPEMPATLDPEESLYSKSKLPPTSQLIEVKLLFVTKCCGSSWVGFFQRADNDFIYVSDSAGGGRVEEMAWSNVFTVSMAEPNASVCIDL